MTAQKYFKGDIVKNKSWFNHAIHGKIDDTVIVNDTIYHHIQNMLNNGHLWVMEENIEYIAHEKTKER